jgi:phosphatidate phosphatase PAH1
VLPRGTPLFVSDVDGTLTERHGPDMPVVCDEESDFPALWRALVGGVTQPKTHDGAAKTFHSLVQAGYRPLYLTARPEFLVDHTRAFLREVEREDGRGDLPQGIIHTTLGITGALNGAAEAFKKEELGRLIAKGFTIKFGFGNRPSDIAAYGAHDVPFRFYYQNADTAWRNCTAVGHVATLPLPFLSMKSGAYRIGSFAHLHAAMAALPMTCN